jgi:predicted GH43/DUF377 family glycosyl hydrolase
MIDDEHLAFSPGRVSAKRLMDTKPLIAPSHHWWESGVTFNPGVLYLERSETNDPIIAGLLPDHSLEDARLSEGIVVVYYRARPAQETDAERPISRSFAGCAIFTPELELLYRYPFPIIAPEEDKDSCDYFGVEDGRLHRFGNMFYYLYCGVSRPSDPDWEWQIRTQLCVARSKDLLCWEKLGAINEEVNKPDFNNKDGVFFPQPVESMYFLLHRPYVGMDYSKYSISLAMSSCIEGPWLDLGTIKSAIPNPAIARHIWVGASAVPIALGNKWYDLHAVLVDFHEFDSQKPSRIITRRVERILVPQTEHECVSKSLDGVANVVFSCGCYEYKGDINILYGGADCCTLAARINKAELLAALESSPASVVPV